MKATSKHLTGDVLVERLITLAYELNLLLRASRGVNVKVDIDTVDLDTHTEIVVQIGKR